MVFDTTVVKHPQALMHAALPALGDHPGPRHID